MVKRALIALLGMVTAVSLLSVPTAQAEFVAQAPAATTKGLPQQFEIMKPQAGRDGRPIAGKTALVGRQFHWQGAYQFIAAPGSDGLAALVSQHPTYENPSQGGHTLWEISAENGLGSGAGRSMVEVGWTHDKALYGDVLARLFCSAWVVDTWLGYSVTGTPNGFVDNPNEPVGCGTALATTPLGNVPSAFYQYQIKRQTVNCWTGVAAPGWRIIQQNQGNTPDRCIGHYPDSLWSAAPFTKASLIQSFGEQVAATVDGPCHDGGSGIFATSTDPSGAAINIAYSHFNAPAGVTNVPTGIFANYTGGGIEPASTYRVYQYPADLDKFKFGGIGYKFDGTQPGGVLNGC